MSVWSAVAAGREAPEAAALVVDGRVWTWAEVGHAIAGLLPSIPPGEGPVALLGTARLRTALGLLALIEAGRPAVLIHPRLSAVERQAQLGSLGLGPVWEVPSPGDSGAAQPPSPPPSRAMAVLFTSGSTGAPRAIQLSRAAFDASARAHAANLPFEPGDRWALAMPLGHVGGLSILTRALWSRTAAVLWEPPAGQDHARFDAELLLDRIARDGVTLLSVVPTMLAALLETGRPLPDRVRAVLLGGAAAPDALLVEAAARGWPVLATYGLTEACSQVCTWPPGTRPDPTLGVGPALSGVQLRVVDGEIQLRGPTLLDAALPPGAHPSPWTSDGWLRTGDLGWIDGRGWLHHSGRVSETIITGGENVSPQEVEAALSGAPGLLSALVFGQPDPVYGERVAAAVVLRPGGSVEGIEAWARDRLAPHRRPRVWVELACIPEASTGKPDRRATAALALARLSAAQAP